MSRWRRKWGVQEPGSNLILAERPGVDLLEVVSVPLGSEMAQTTLMESDFGRRLPIGGFSTKNRKVGSEVGKPTMARSFASGAGMIRPAMVKKSPQLPSGCGQEVAWWPRSYRRDNSGRIGPGDDHGRAEKQDGTCTPLAYKSRPHGAPLVMVKLT